MKSEQRLLALIPARSGSVRVPDKNAREFAGLSLIEIAVDGALKSAKIDHVGLSTDSESYLKRASRAGLNETYLRPENIAGPEATSAECVLDYLKWSSEHGGGEFTHVVLLQPTSPFRTSKDIDVAIDFWRQSGKPSLVSAVRMSPEPQFIVGEDPANNQLFRYSETDNSELCVLDGALFITPVEMVKDDGAFWNQDSALFKFDYPRFFDIDTQADFDAASVLYSKETDN